MIAFAVGLMMPIAAAYPWIAFCDRESPGVATFFLRLSLAIGVGIGVSACIWFLGLFFFGPPSAMFRGGEMVFFALACATGCFVNSARGPSSGGLAWTDTSTTSRILLAVFVVSGILAIAGAAAMFARSPLGDWDAWAIWNLRARTLFRAGDAWRTAFSPVYVHADYPLLVPVSNMRGWSYLGGEASWSPWLLGVLLTSATVGVLTAGVCRLRGRTLGLLAGTTLLGTIAFIQCGAAQYADVPLAFFIVSAVLSLVFYDASPQHPRGLLVLSGLTASLAAWTKNEGLLFSLVLFAVRAAIVGRRQNVKHAFQEMIPWILGALPALAIIALQKTCLASENDLVDQSQWNLILPRLFDPSRYWLAGQSLVLGALRTMRTMVVMLPVAYLLLGTAKSADRNLSGWSTALGTLGGMFFGYFCVYVVTSGELQWHLNTSVGRLMIQLCPLAILIVFLKMGSPEAAMGRQPGPLTAV
jgi:hypothetical protein